MVLAAGLFFGVAATGFSGVARAQSDTMPEAGAFDALSKADKRVAEALFNGQIVTANGKAPLSLDLIAASKHRTGWGRIFSQLRRDGLIDAKNLKDLMRRQRQGTAVSSRPGPARPTGGTVVTTAGGRQIIVDKNSLTREGGRNTGRDKNRRGSRSIGKYTDDLFGTAGTYRGRLNNAAQSDGAASIGITSGKGVATSNIITR